MNHTAATGGRPARPLEPVSEVTKNKRSAFNFCAPAAGETKAGETSPNSDENSTEQNKHKSTLSADVSLPETDKGSATPVSRLAWHDLIGAPQQRDDRQDAASPNERILWDTRQDQSYKASPMMPRKRGKKRARSSSPTSSPAAKPKANTPVVNVKKLAEALKSPHADPALELWDRFALSGSTTAVTPLGATNPALAQVMVSSSPQPSKILGTVPAEGGLRRTISCGANFPKRRKVDRVEPVELLKATVEESPSGASKSSMVNALVRSVTGELNRSKAARVQHEALQSPTPKSKRRHATPPVSSSPTQPSSPSKPISPLRATKNNGQGQRDTEPDNGSTSDYGDDDFDDDTLMELDASLTAPPGEADDGDATLLPSSTPPPPDTGQKSHGAALGDDLDAFDDEFGDLGDEVFAVAEDLITKIDSNPSSTHNANAVPPPVTAPQNTVSEDSSEDLYGDDFGGDFDFEAAEIAATQSAKQTQISGSLPSVRR